jgi:hypothetical protein
MLKNTGRIVEFRMAHAALLADILSARAGDRPASTYWRRIIRMR